MIEEFLQNIISKKTRKIIGGGLMLIAFLLLSPPFLPLPDDILNIAIANWLAINYGINTMTSLIYTYTIIPITILIVGIYIYPKKNGKIITDITNKFRGYVNKFVNIAKRQPLKAAIIVGVGYIVFKFYMQIIEGMIV